MHLPNTIGDVWHFDPFDALKDKAHPESTHSQVNGLKLSPILMMYTKEQDCPTTSGYLVNYLLCVSSITSIRSSLSSVTVLISITISSTLSFLLLLLLLLTLFHVSQLLMVNGEVKNFQCSFYIRLQNLQNKTQAFM